MSDNFNNQNIEYFSDDEMTVAYKYYSKSHDKKTILLIYGFCGNIYMTDYFAKYFEDQFTVLVIDYPGHGYSPKNDNFTINNFVSILNKLLNFLNENDLLLIGYSFGGIIGLQFYLENTHRIKKIVFLNATSNFCANPYYLLFFKIFEIMLKINFGFVMKFIAIPFLRDKYFTNEMLSEGRKIVMINDKKSVIINYKNIVYKNNNYILPLIDCPTLVIGSKKDFLVAEKSSKMFSSKIKKSKYHLLSDIGHLSIISKPDSVSEIIINFLKN